MEVRLKPELQAKLDQMAIETGRPSDELVEDAVSGFFDELAQTREMLNRRYNETNNGLVQLIDGEEAFARLKAKTDAQRTAAA
jgi:predicted transcriptional regulator